MSAGGHENRSPEWGYRDGVLPSNPHINHVYAQSRFELGWGTPGGQTFATRTAKKRQQSSAMSHPARFAFTDLDTEGTANAADAGDAIERAPRNAADCRYTPMHTQLSGSSDAGHFSAAEQLKAWRLLQDAPETAGARAKQLPPPATMREGPALWSPPPSRAHFYPRLSLPSGGGGGEGGGDGSTVDNRQSPSEFVSEEATRATPPSGEAIFLGFDLKRISPAVTNHTVATADQTGDVTEDPDEAAKTVAVMKQRQQQRFQQRQRSQQQQQQQQLGKLETVREEDGVAINITDDDNGIAEDDEPLDGFAGLLTPVRATAPSSSDSEFELFGFPTAVLTPSTTLSKATREETVVYQPHEDADVVPYDLPDYGGPECKLPRHNPHQRESAVATASDVLSSTTCSTTRPAKELPTTKSAAFPQPKAQSQPRHALGEWAQPRHALGELSQTLRNIAAASLSSSSSAASAMSTKHAANKHQQRQRQQQPQPQPLSLSQSRQPMRLQQSAYTATTAGAENAPPTSQQGQQLVF
jgi:hypothetical protein